MMRLENCKSLNPTQAELDAVRQPAAGRSTQAAIEVLIDHTPLALAALKYELSERSIRIAASRLCSTVARMRQVFGGGAK